MFVPLSDDNEDFDTPYVNYALMLICIAVYIVQFHILSDENNLFAFTAFGFNAANFMQGYDGLSPGGKALMLLDTFFNPFHAGWLQAVTSTFMHAGFIHLAGNMYFLWIFGDNVEHAMGRLRYFFFFILTGILAQMTQTAVVGPVDCVGIGASGAISAVMGAYLVYYPRARINMYLLNGLTYMMRYYNDTFGYHFQWKARTYLVFFLATQAWMGYATYGVKYFNIAVWAHIGGFLSGVILAWPLKDPAMLFMDEANKKFGRHATNAFDGKSQTSGPITGGGHRRPSLRQRLQKGKDEMKRRRDRGSDWYKD